MKRGERKFNLPTQIRVEVAAAEQNAAVLLVLKILWD